MSKRIRSAIASALSHNLEKDTSDDECNEEKYNHRWKRQRRVDCYPSEFSECTSPTSVLHLAESQRQRNPRALAAPRSKVVIKPRPKPKAKLSLKKLFVDSDSESDGISVADDTGYLVFDVETTNQDALEKLQVKARSLWARMKDEDDDWKSTVVTKKCKSTSGHFTVGQGVRITEDFCRPHLRGKTGTIVGQGRSSLCFEVEFDDGINNRNFRYSSLEAKQTKSKTTKAVGQRVRISKDFWRTQLRGKTGTIVGQGGTSLTFKVEFDDGKKCRNFRHSSLEALDSSTTKEFDESKRTKRKTTKTANPRKQNSGSKQLRRRKSGKNESVALSAVAQSLFSPQIVAKDAFWGLSNADLIMPNNDPKDKKDELCYFKHMQQLDRLTFKVSLKKNEEVEIRTNLRGRFGDYDLVSVKVYDEKSEGYMYAQKNYVAKVIYAAVNDENPIEDRLLRLANFAKLNPRKVAARLELFQSPTKHNIVCYDDASAMFQTIPDLGYVGGGFIHEATLVDLMEKAGEGATAARRAIAIQVRIFIPSMGIFKGVLVKKRTRNGPPIELPCSMQKVPPSDHPHRFKGAWILICKYRVHPSSGNVKIGEKLDPTVEDPKEKTFRDSIKRPLSGMIFRLWETLGVPADLCERYKTESLHPNRRNHAWLVGVPDPTGALPPDTIFLPGMHKKEPYDIFVTRFPCYLREHGRKFRAITQKPRRMTDANWKWLNNEFKFGAIIFSNPRPGMLSIPERIADGDLDGDLYLVCWDKEVVDSMTTTPLVDELASDDGQLSTLPSNPNWFSESQKVNVDKIRSAHRHLIGALCNLGAKKAISSDKKLDDPDSRALFNAYNEALEYQKHGRPIRLPKHLKKELTKKLHHLVIWI